MLSANKVCLGAKSPALSLRASKRLLRNSRPVPTRQRLHASSDFTDGEPEKIVLPLPEGATNPSEEPVMAPAWFGFVDNAERVNSRFAMIGFFGIVFLEAISGKGILELIGLSVGSGLGFEF